MNTSIGFSLNLPRGWSVPSNNDDDPHLINCAGHDGFEVHNSNNASWLYASQYEEYSHPRETETIKIFNDLIPNAIVREFRVINPEEGGSWPHWSIILFEKEKQAFFFASEKKIDQYPFMSTFKLLGNAGTSTSPDTVANQNKSYAYLFEGNRNANTSNIVGYFGNGAFAWYVPDWLVTNWKMVSYGSQGMVFVPLVRDDPNYFTDISFTVSSSTELYNAENLYQTRLDTARKSDLILHEVLLNQHEGDMISMQIETDTRIYHIIDMDGDGIHMRDAYYIDGNGKTVVIMLEAKSDIFPQFTDKIRNMVEGIGELKSSQG